MREFRVHRQLSYYLKILNKRDHCSQETVTEKINYFSSISEDISNEGVFEKESLSLHQIVFAWESQRRSSQETEMNCGLGARATPLSPQWPSCQFGEIVV